MQPQEVLYKLLLGMEFPEDSSEESLYFRLLYPVFPILGMKLRLPGKEETDTAVIVDVTLDRDEIFVLLENDGYEPDDLLEMCPGWFQAAERHEECNAWRTHADILGQPCSILYTT